MYTVPQVGPYTLVSPAPFSPFHVCEPHRCRQVSDASEAHIPLPFPFFDRPTSSAQRRRLRTTAFKKNKVIGTSFSLPCNGENVQASSLVRIRIQWRYLYNLPFSPASLFPRYILSPAANRLQQQWMRRLLQNAGEHNFEISTGISRSCAPPLHIDSLPPITF